MLLSKDQESLRILNGEAEALSACILRHRTSRGKPAFKPEIWLIAPLFSELDTRRRTKRD